MKALLALAFAAGVAFASPQVSNVDVSEPDIYGCIKVTYNLNEDAIVVARFTSSAEEIPESANTYLDGDINKIVTNRVCSFKWDSRHAWPGHYITGNVSVEIEARSLDNPPRYCVIDLTHGQDLNLSYQPKQYLLEFYTSSNTVPGGINCDRYKREKLILRKIDRTGPQGFLMGSPEWEAHRNSGLSGDRERQHQVVLTKDYWMGCFSVTQEQYRRVMGTTLFTPMHKWGGPPNYGSMCPTKPMESNSYEEVRGFLADGYNWPKTGTAVDPDKFLGVLRTRTGNIYKWDFPTVAQWENAARAGNANSLIDGTGGAVTDEAWTNRVLRLTGNTLGTSYVGSYPPNKLGIYDLLDSVKEWCRDWLLPGPLTNAVNPVGEASGQYREVKSNAYAQWIGHYRIARRAGQEPDLKAGWVGFRLSATIEE